MKTKLIKKTALVLSGLGAVTWGTSIFNFNIVSWLAGVTAPVVATILYALIGASGIYALIRVFKK